MRSFSSTGVFEVRSISRLVRLGAVALATSGILGLTVASPAFAAPGTPVHGSHPANDRTVPRRTANYIVRSESSESHQVLPAYATGCGFHVIVYRTGNTIIGSTLTDCDSVQTRIWHQVTIQRSRWWGWPTVDSDYDWRYGVSSFALDRQYPCGGTGTHDFRAIGEGQILLGNGDVATARAYDEIDGQTC